MTKNHYGVLAAILAVGLFGTAAPEATAQGLMAANGAGAAALPAKPAASSPAELDRRIEALEGELASLRAEMTARKQTEVEETSAASASLPMAVPATPAAAQDAAPTGLAALLGPTSVSGFVDTYYNVNFNHPSSNGVGFRAFDFRDKSISLNMVELVLDKVPDASGPAGRTGYHVALGYGDAMNVVNSFDPANFNTGTSGAFVGGHSQYLKEAYFSYLAPVGKGLQVDVGKFVTPHGAELIESKDNWNYSRSMLFTWTIPFYHFGVRAKYVFNDKYSLTAYLVNGWNNIVDNNSGKTYGLSLGWTPIKKFSLTTNYMAGPETSTGGFGPGVNVNNFWRQMWDLVAIYNVTDKLTFMANYDYMRGDRTVTDSESTPWTLSDPVYTTGIGGYLKYVFNDKNYVAGRYEYFEDHDGFMTGTSIPRVHFNTATLTYQRTLANYLLARFEYRRDTSQFPVYSISTFGPGVKHQDTAALGLIFLFDSRNAK